MPRIHLREGARVLVEPDDRDTYDNVLAGKITESQPASELCQCHRHVS